MYGWRYTYAGINGNFHNTDIEYLPFHYQIAEMKKFRAGVHKRKNARNYWVFKHFVKKKTPKRASTVQGCTKLTCAKAEKICYNISVE